MVRDRAERPKERSRRRTKRERGEEILRVLCDGEGDGGPSEDPQPKTVVLHLSSWSFLAPKLYQRLHLSAHDLKTSKFHATPRKSRDLDFLLVRKPP